MIEISSPADIAISVLVDGFKGEFGARLLTAKLLEGHLAVLVAISLIEDGENRLSEKVQVETLRHRFTKTLTYRIPIINGIHLQGAYHVSDLGWVDFYLGCSTIMPGQ